MGVAGFPRDGDDANELVHQADLAVYRAKLQGRNRVLDASRRAAARAARQARARVSPRSRRATSRYVRCRPAAEIDPRGRPPPARTAARAPAPRFFSVPRRLALLVGLVGLLGTARASSARSSATRRPDRPRPIVVLVGLGQVLSLEVEETGSISVSAVGALAGAAIVGPRAALALALTMAAVDWSARRAVFHQLLFNVGALTLASLAAAAVFSIHLAGRSAPGIFVASAASSAGSSYFVVNTGLVSLAVGVEGRENPFRCLARALRWLLPHYLVYGFIAAVIYEAYKPIGAVGDHRLRAAPLPDAQDAGGVPRAHAAVGAQAARGGRDDPDAERVARAGEPAAQGALDRGDGVPVGDGRCARLLHRRPLAPRAAACARDRRELGLSQAELELLGHAALFHDIGKLGIPDAILLKPRASPTRSGSSWRTTRRRARRSSTASASSATLCRRSGTTTSASTGSGYPDGLAGEDIPLGARIIHVADAFDSMLTTRVYRAGAPGATRRSRSSARTAGNAVLPAVCERPRGDRRDANRRRPSAPAREPPLV